MIRIQLAKITCSPRRDAGCWQQTLQSTMSLWCKSKSSSASLPSERFQKAHRHVLENKITDGYPILNQKLMPKPYHRTNRRHERATFASLSSHRASANQVSEQGLHTDAGFLQIASFHCNFIFIFLLKQPLHMPFRPYYH